MNKIGAAVCYDTKNFGSQLQVLATIQILKELGAEVEIIQYKKKITPIFIIQTIPRLFNPFFISNKIKVKHKNREIKKHPKISEKTEIRNKRFDEFVNRHFAPLLKKYCGWETLVKESAQNYDMFLCGSDQLWLPSNLGSHFYTLEFAPDNKPKISYATSFGVRQIPYYQKKRTARYLNRFEALSTRELTGAGIVEKLTGKKAQVVCDPTLLFNASEWCKIIPNKPLFDEPYVFCYFLGTNPDYRKAANRFKNETGLKLVTCPFLDNFVKADRTFGDIQLFDMDASDFVNLIRYADYILTDSFHGSVFSILNHKKFLTFDRFGEGKNSRNSRIDSLCALLGLGERRYAGNTSVIYKEIDYVKTDELLKKLREESLNYLKKAINRE